MTLPIPNHTLVKKLGEGQWGDVWLGEHVFNGRLAAIKILKLHDHSHEDYSKRFLRECQQLAKFDHPNIVRIYDSGKVGNLGYLVTEYLPGGTLRERLRRGTVSVAEALTLTVQISAALGVVHRQDMIHRDLKPENIMLREPSVPVLLDFGIARQLGHSTVVRRDGSVVGTASYMSPEQIRNGELDGRCDLYALGVLFYELLVGRLPFRGGSLDEICSQHLYAPLPRLPRPLEMLQPILDRLLAKIPSDRFGTARDFVDALRGSFLDEDALRRQVGFSGTGMAWSSQLRALGFSLESEQTDAVRRAQGLFLDTKARVAASSAGAGISRDYRVTAHFEPSQLDRDIGELLRLRMELGALPGPIAAHPHAYVLKAKLARMIEEVQSEDSLRLVRQFVDDIRNALGERVDFAELTRELQGKAQSLAVKDLLSRSRDAAGRGELLPPRSGNASDLAHEASRIAPDYAPTREWLEQLVQLVAQAVTETFQRGALDEAGDLVERALAAFSNDFRLLSLRRSVAEALESRARRERHDGELRELAQMLMDRPSDYSGLAVKTWLRTDEADRKLAGARILAHNLRTWLEGVAFVREVDRIAAIRGDLDNCWGALLLDPELAPAAKALDHRFAELTEAARKERARMQFRAQAEAASAGRRVLDDSTDGLLAALGSLLAEGFQAEAAEALRAAAPAIQSAITDAIRLGENGRSRVDAWLDAARRARVPEKVLQTFEALRDRVESERLLALQLEVARRRIESDLVVDPGIDVVLQQALALRPADPDSEVGEALRQFGDAFSAGLDRCTDEARWRELSRTAGSIEERLEASGGVGAGLLASIRESRQRSAARLAQREAERKADQLAEAFSAAPTLASLAALQDALHATSSALSRARMESVLSAVDRGLSDACASGQWEQAERWLQAISGIAPPQWAKRHSQRLADKLEESRRKFEYESRRKRIEDRVQLACSRPRLFSAGDDGIIMLVAETATEDCALLRESLSNRLEDIKLELDWAIGEGEVSEPALARWLDGMGAALSEESLRALRAAADRARQRSRAREGLHALIASMRMGEVDPARVAATLSACELLTGQERRRLGSTPDELAEACGAAIDSAVGAASLKVIERALAHLESLHAAIGGSDSALGPVLGEKIARRRTVLQQAEQRRVAEEAFNAWLASHSVEALCAVAAAADLDDPRPYSKRVILRLLPLLAKQLALQRWDEHARLVAAATPLLAPSQVVAFASERERARLHCERVAAKQAAERRRAEQRERLDRLASEFARTPDATGHLVLAALKALDPAERLGDDTAELRSALGRWLVRLAETNRESFDSLSIAHQDWLRQLPELHELAEAEERLRLQQVQLYALAASFGKEPFPESIRVAAALAELDASGMRTPAAVNLVCAFRDWLVQLDGEDLLRAHSRLREFWSPLAGRPELAAEFARVERLQRESADKLLAEQQRERTMAQLAASLGFERVFDATEGLLASLAKCTKAGCAGEARVWLDAQKPDLERILALAVTAGKPDREFLGRWSRELSERCDFDAAGALRRLIETIGAADALETRLESVTLELRSGRLAGSTREVIRDIAGFSKGHRGAALKAAGNRFLEALNDQIEQCADEERLDELNDVIIWIAEAWGDSSQEAELARTAINTSRQRLHIRKKENSHAPGKRQTLSPEPNASQGRKSVRTPRGWVWLAVLGLGVSVLIVSLMLGIHPQGKTISRPLQIPRISPPMQPPPELIAASGWQAQTWAWVVRLKLPETYASKAGEIRNKRGRAEQMAAAGIFSGANAEYQGAIDEAQGMLAEAFRISAESAKDKAYAAIKAERLDQANSHIVDAREADSMRQVIQQWQPCKADCSGEAGLAEEQYAILRQRSQQIRWQEYEVVARIAGEALADQAATAARDSRPFEAMMYYLGARRALHSSVHAGLLAAEKQLAQLASEATSKSQLAIARQKLDTAKSARAKRLEWERHY